MKKEEIIFWLNSVLEKPMTKKVESQLRINLGESKKTYKLNGKYVEKKQISKDAILVQTVNEEHYETAEYKKQQLKNASKYFSEQRENREDLEKRHG